MCLPNQSIITWLAHICHVTNDSSCPSPKLPLPLQLVCNHSIVKTTNIYIYIYHSVVKTTNIYPLHGLPKKNSFRVRNIFMKHSSGKLFKPFTEYYPCKTDWCMWSHKQLQHFHDIPSSFGKLRAYPCAWQARLHASSQTSRWFSWVPAIAAPL